MPMFIVEAIIEVAAPDEFDAKCQVISSFDADKVSSLVVHSVVPKRTPYDEYADAKAAFYAACEGDGVNMARAATEYLDAAIKALHARQLDTTQLMSVWSDVKPYL